MTSLDRLKELESKATSGKWTSRGYQIDDCKEATICNMSGWKNLGITKANGEMICAARNALPNMLKIIKMAKEALENAEATLRLHRSAPLIEVTDTLAAIREFSKDTGADI